MSKRDDAAKLMEKIPQTPAGIQSNLQPDLFFEWTGYKHADLMQSWRDNMAGPKLLTACAGYASKIGGLLGITDIASYFDLEKSLAAVGKSYAWVPASSGADPKVGDILRHTVFHVDVAAGWDGRKLKRVAAGQSLHPRPTTNVEKEFDALKWVTGIGPYNSANLQGWLDLDKYFAAAPAPGPSPGPGPTLGWLNGWWKVWDGNTYYYHFGANNVAKYTTQPPANLGAPPAHATNVGTYTYTPPNTLAVTWNRIPSAPMACTETFHNALLGCKQMKATSDMYGPLTATRLEGAGNA